MAEILKYHRRDYGDLNLDGFIEWASRNANFADCLSRIREAEVEWRKEASKRYNQWLEGMGKMIRMDPHLQEMLEKERQNQKSEQCSLYH